MVKFGTSQPIRRLEDARFLTGRGRYTDDIRLPGMVYGYVLRSPHAHARIGRIESRDSRSLRGVLAVFIGADLAADGVRMPPCKVPMTNRDGTRGADPRRPVLCTDRVRHVGEAVAFVVAETPEAARDAAEATAVEYEPLDAVADAVAALAPGSPLVHDDVPGNLAFDWEFGDAQATAKAFAGAAHVTRLELRNNRLVAAAIEPRAAVAEFDQSTGRLALSTGTQGGWDLQDDLARHVLKVAPDRVRVITPDVGGGFGMKLFTYPEHALCAWAARRLGRPVKWTAERTESFVSDTMGRDHATVGELAFDSGHRILGVRVETVANMGAYLSMYAPYIPTSAAVKVLGGTYDVKHLLYRVKGALTHTVPVDAYRGAGRPESIFLIERLMDKAARELGIDRAELRRRNFIPPTAMPFRTAVGETYDSGEFARVLAAALAAADAPGFADRRRRAADRGRRSGLGFAYYIESTMGNVGEGAAVRFADDGSVHVLVGTQSTGQGHETAYAQILHERLGIPLERIRIVQGDTDAVAKGGGTGGSRSLTAQGWALLDAAEKVVERGRRAASQILEASVADIEFADGRFRIVGTDRAIGILELARKARALGAQRAEFRDGLDVAVEIEVAHWTFPNGCHVAEVEIDEETGAVRLVRYTVVDDFGRVLNPLLVAGQVHGGAAQGIGQALLEHAIYGDDGQLRSGSFVDYCLPRADDLPPIAFTTVEVPCRNNPLGVKGCGEAGAIGAPPAVVNAVVDALADLGVDHVDMPATAEKIWRLMRAHPASARAASPTPAARR